MIQIDPQEMAQLEQSKEDFKQKICLEVDQFFYSLVSKLNNNGHPSVDTPPLSDGSSVGSFQEAPLNLVYRSTNVPSEQVSGNLMMFLEQI